MGKGDTVFGKAWIAVGDIENWERGLENGIWGIVPGLEHHWRRIEQNDVVLFYCKRPISRFFGAGLIRSKFQQTKPLWKEELHENRVIWPYRFEFDIICLLPLEEWDSSGVSNEKYNLAILGGLNPVRDNTLAQEIIAALSPRIESKIFSGKDMALMLCEMGKIQRMIVETHYPVEDYTLDVVWKRVVRSVPTFSYVINLTDPLERSVSSLKHAHDIWNSRPFLIVDEKRISDAREASSGLYHEFEPSLKILSFNQISELYNAKKTFFDLEERYGMR